MADEIDNLVNDVGGIDQALEAQILEDAERTEYVCCPEHKYDHSYDADFLDEDAKRTEDDIIYIFGEFGEGE